MPKPVLKSHLEQTTALNARFATMSEMLDNHISNHGFHHIAGAELFDAKCLLEYAHGFLKIIIDHPVFMPKKESLGEAKLIDLARVLDAGGLVDYYNQGASGAKQSKVSFEDVLLRVLEDVKTYGSENVSESEFKR